MSKKISSQPAVSRQSQAQTLSEHIARLQQRQMEMVQQTAHELEAIQRELQDNNQVDLLERQISALEAERAALHQELAKTQQESEQTISSVRQIVLEHMQSLEQKLHVVEPAAIAHTPFPETLPVVPVVERVIEQVPTQMTDVRLEKRVEPRAPKEKRARRFSPRRLAIRFVSLAILASGGWYGWTKFLAPTPYQAGQVAGASTLKPAAQATTDPFAAAYAEVDFAKTEWEPTTNVDFNLKFEYPKNSSVLSYTIGSSNEWVVRKNGYLLQITQILTTQPLDQWWQSNSSTYNPDNNKVTSTPFKGLPAIFVDTKEKTITSGSSYFVKRSDGIYRIWMKDEVPTTDDGQRLAHMVQSIIFTK